MLARPSIDRLEDGPSAEAITGFRTGMMPFWHPVMEVADLSGDRPSAVTLLGRRLVLARLDGELVVLPDTCRHFQARLSLGSLVPVAGETGIQCAYHGWTFGRNGRCLRIPQLAKSRAIPKTANLPSYRAVERYGLVWVCLAEDATFPIPDFPEIDDPAFRKVRLRETEQPPSLVSTDMSQPDAASLGPVRLHYTDHVGMPNVIRLVKDSPAGRYVIWLASCAVDFDQAINFWIFARNYDLDPAKDAAFEALSAHVRLQDKPVIESQRPWIIPPFWTQIEMPIGPGDLPLIEYQKWLEELKIATAV